MPEVIFFEPWPFATLTARSSSLRSFRVTAFGTPPTISTGLSPAGTEAAASPSAAGLGPSGPWRVLASAREHAPSAGGAAFLGFSFLGADFLRTWNGYWRLDFLGLVTPGLARALAGRAFCCWCAGRTGRLGVRMPRKPFGCLERLSCRDSRRRSPLDHPRVCGITWRILFSCSSDRSGAHCWHRGRRRDDEVGPAGQYRRCTVREYPIFFVAGSSRRATRHGRLLRLSLS